MTRYPPKHNIDHILHKPKDENIHEDWQEVVEATPDEVWPRIFANPAVSLVLFITLLSPNADGDIAVLGKTSTMCLRGDEKSNYGLC
jgi:hypothetical protein